MRQVEGTVCNISFYWDRESHPWHSGCFWDWTCQNRLGLF